MSMLLLFASTPVTPLDVTAIDALVHGSSCTVTMTGGGASQGTITLDGAAQTITAWSDTSATFTVARGNSRYGGVTVVVTNAGGTSSDIAPGTILSPPTGWSYVNLLDPLATSGDRITALPDLAGGDQLSYGNVQGTGTVTIGTYGVMTFEDASIAFDSWATAFDVEANDGTGWGDVATQTLDPGGGAPTTSAQKRGFGIMKNGFFSFR